MENKNEVTKKDNNTVIVSFVDFWHLAAKGPHPASARVAIALSFGTQLLIQSLIFFLMLTTAEMFVFGEVNLLYNIFFAFMYKGLCLIDFGVEKVDKDIFREMTNRATIADAKTTVSIWRLLLWFMVSTIITVLFIHSVEVLDAVTNFFSLYSSYSAFR